jgi:hypothetical protein
MISADLAAASVVRDLRDCSLRFVKAASALFGRSLSLGPQWA